MTTHKYHSKKA